MTRSRMFALGIALVVAGTLLTTRAAARQASVADARLQGALTKEVVEGKCDEAIPLYQQVLATNGVSRATAAKALLQLAGCLEKTAKPADAGAALQRLIADYPSSPEAATARGRATTVRSADAPGGPFRVTALPHLRSARFVRSSVSPDGRMLAYAMTIEENATLRPGLMVLDLRTGAERFLDDRQGLFALAGMTPQWSPDGRRLAYQVRNFTTGVGELRVFTVATGEVRTLKSWSPSGAPLRAWVFSWAGDSDTIVTHLRLDPPARGTGPVAPEATDISLVSATSGQSRVVGSSQGQVVFAWSADGRSVAFREIRASDNVHQIRVVRPANGLSKSFAGTGTGLGLLWSPNGGSLAARERDAVAKLDQIRIFTVVTGESRVVAIPAEAEAAGIGGGWTPKDEFYLSRPVSGGTDFFLLPVSGGGLRKICEARLGGDTCLFLTPDGATQILRNNLGRIVLRRTSDGGDVALTRGAGEENAPLLSADGRLITFASNRNGSWALYVVPLDRSPVDNPVAIAAIDEARAELPPPGVLTARGQLLYRSTGNEDHLYRIDVDPASGRGLDGRKPIRLTLSHPNNDWPEPSPDGRHIAFRYARGPRSGVAVMGSDGSRERSVFEYATAPIATAPPAAGPAKLGPQISWRSAEEVMFTVPGEAGIRIANLRTGAASTLPFDLSGAVSRVSVDWAYVRGRDEILYAASSTSTNLAGALRARALTTGAERIVAEDVAEFVVSPDGRFVGYRRDLPERAVELRRVGIDGTDFGVLKAFPPRKECCPASPEAFSPDNKFFLFSSPNGRQRALNVDTGEDWLLFDHDADPAVEEWDFPGPRWSPDGTYVVVEGMSTRVETRLWEGITYEAVTKLMSGRR